MYTLRRACVAAQLLVPALDNFVSPDCLCSAPEDVRIVALGPQLLHVIHWHTASEAFPGVAVLKVRSICVDRDRLLAVIYASRIWISWCANKLRIHNDMLPVGRVPGLNLLLSQIACNAEGSTRVDVE